MHLFLDSHSVQNCKHQKNGLPSQQACNQAKTLETEKMSLETRKFFKNGCTARASLWPGHSDCFCALGANSRRFPAHWAQFPQISRTLGPNPRRFPAHFLPFFTSGRRQPLSCSFQRFPCTCRFFGCSGEFPIFVVLLYPFGSSIFCWLASGPDLAPVVSPPATRVLCIVGRSVAFFCVDLVQVLSLVGLPEKLFTFQVEKKDQ